MVYTDKWFFEQGKNEGHFGVRLLKTDEISEENNDIFMKGYAIGAMERASEDEPTKIKTDLARAGYIRAIGHAVAESGYPATDEQLPEEYKIIFEEGYQSGIKKGKSR